MAERISAQEVSQRLASNRSNIGHFLRKRLSLGLWKVLPKVNQAGSDHVGHNQN